MTRPSVLVLHDRPDELRPLLSARLSDLDLTFASAPDAVLPALERARPGVVFSIKHSGFPGAAHRPAIDFPTVRWVQIGGSGYEHFAPWDARRVTVTNCHGVLARVLAETVLAAVLTLNRGLLAHRDRQRARVWSPTRFRPLAGQTLLIVGVGAIGGELATLARALGLHVVGIRRGAVAHPAIDEVFPPEALHAQLARADIVSVHLRATNETARLFDARAFAAMKRGATFVNTSRGAVVDESALVDALRAGIVGAAYLDVFEREPLPAESPLWAMDEVLLTPHCSDNVDDWPLRFAAAFADNMDRWRAGAPLANVVAP
ncbi:MAG: D-2-hydroxyacid dehydrogenase [Polyangiales bacterium]